jgi:tRNA(fMet)-specific endonuclease VapC
MSYLLDTNIVSLMVKLNRQVLDKINDLKSQRKSIFISCITYFEIRRGFLAVDAPKQRERFNQICQIYPIILLDDLAIIAATAMVKDLVLVSNDTDLTRVEGLNLENWVE